MAQEAETVDEQVEDVENPEVEADDTEPETEDESPDVEKLLAKIRKTNSENKNLRKRASEAEAKAKESEGSSEELAKAQAENLRLKVAVKHGLPEQLVSRLSGTTEEELLQDAETLMELFSVKKPPTQQPKDKLHGGGDPTVPVDPIGDPDKFAAEMFKR